MNKKKINILHGVTSFEDGGLEKVVSLIVNNVNSDLIQHHVVSLIKSKTEFLLDEFTKTDSKVINFAFHNRVNNLKSFFINIKEVFRLAKYIRYNRINIIHSHDFFPAFIVRTAAIISFIFYLHKINKIFITLHNLFYWLSPIHHNINKILSLYTSKIICVSESVKNYSNAHDKINSKKYKVIYNGVEIDEYYPNCGLIEFYKKEFSILPGEIIIGNVGVLSVRKGQIYLLKALKKLINKNYKVKLLIFGSERDHEKEIASEIYNYISKNKLEEKVLIINPRKDLNLIYNIFDIFVMPSITEGLSLSAAEAMLMERICVFSNIPPFREMVNDGENAFLFKSEDVNDLYLKLEFILNNLDNLKFIGKNARITALEKFDAKRMCKDYENLYLV